MEKTKEYNLENAAKGYLPQFALSAKASYQSDVTEIPVKLPGVDLKGLPKDQYQVMLELQQKIWDGGGIRMQKKQTIAEAEVEKEKLNVDMYALNDRVNDLYFGILLLDEQIKQNTLLQDELERNYRQITAYVENGIANQADFGCSESGAVEYPSEESGTDFFPYGLFEDAFVIDGRGAFAGDSIGEACSSKRIVGCQ